MSILDDELRARDFDRWLASRFVADEGARARLVALYILAGEWSRIAGAVTNPLAGEIRLTWWAEAVERFAAGATPEHPALAALGSEATARLQPHLQAAITARYADLDGGGPNIPAETAVMRAAVALLDPEADLTGLEPVAEAWAVRSSGSLAAADSAARTLSVTAFPAVTHVALVRAYGAGRSLGDLEKRARLTWAVLTGRL